MAEIQGPRERRVSRVLGQDRRREGQPGRERDEGGRDVPGAARRGDRPREQVRGHRGAREQERVQRMSGGLRRRRARAAVEGRQEERVELAQRAVVPPVDLGDRRKALADARREPRHLKLVRHHRPRGRLHRVVACESSRAEDARGDDEHRCPQSDREHADTPTPAARGSSCSSGDVTARLSIPCLDTPEPRDSPGC